MKKNTMNQIAVAVVVFGVCIILVSVMLMQFKTVEETDITEIESMREEELRVALSEWKTKYQDATSKLEETNQKIEEYNQKIGKREETSELIDQELEQSNIILGKTDVYGEGVVVTLNDGEIDIEAYDLIKLVNELKYAGAEAISINESRIISTTDIVDIDYAFIMANGQRLEAPYVVKAIGNQAYLSSILNLKDSGYIDVYKNSGKTVSMETKKKIEIPKYNGELSTKYLTIS